MSRPDVQVEQLIGPAELDVGNEVDRVVRLRQRIQELVHPDRLPALEALLEVAALQHLRHVVLRRQPDPSGAAQRLEPLAVEADLRLRRVEDLEDLRLVGLGVAVDLLLRQRRPRLRPAGRIADQRGERAHDVDHPMAEILEVLHLANEHGVPQVQIGRGRIEADLHDERRPARREPLELGLQLARTNDVDTAFGEIRELLVYRHRAGIGIGRCEVSRFCTSLRVSTTPVDRRPTSRRIPTVDRRLHPTATATDDCRLSTVPARVPPTISPRCRANIARWTGGAVRGAPAARHSSRDSRPRASARSTGAGAYGFLYERHHVEVTRATLPVSGWADGARGPAHRLPHRPPSQRDRPARTHRARGRSPPATSSPT